MLDFWFIDIGYTYPQGTPYFTSASMAEVAGKLASTYSLNASILFHEHDNSADLEHADLAWCEAKTCYSFRTTISLGKRIVTMALHVLACMTYKAGWECDVSGGGLLG